MKRFLMVLLVLVTAVRLAAAQDEGIMKDFTVSGDLRMGANYLPLFGIHASENMALYTELMAIHKSGFGVGYFAFDDFSKEAFGRIRFVDALYTKTWGKFSMYGAMEYVWYDNNKNGGCVMPYAIGTYTHNSWSFQIGNMVTYFPHRQEDKYEFTMYGKIMKNVFRDIDMHMTIWYDNLYNANSHFYGAAGLKVSLPKGFYVMSTLLYREKAECLLNFGWRF